jgi:hypothetical protein
LPTDVGQACDFKSGFRFGAINRHKQEERTTGPGVSERPGESSRSSPAIIRETRNAMRETRNADFAPKSQLDELCSPSLSRLLWTSPVALLALCPKGATIWQDPRRRVNIVHFRGPVHETLL